MVITVLLAGVLSAEEFKWSSGYTLDSEREAAIYEKYYGGEKTPGTLEKIPLPEERTAQLTQKEQETAEVINGQRSLFLYYGPAAGITSAAPTIVGELGYKWFFDAFLIGISEQVYMLSDEVIIDEVKKIKSLGTMVGLTLFVQTLAPGGGWFYGAGIGNNFALRSSTNPYNFKLTPDSSIAYALRGGYTWVHAWGNIVFQTELRFFGREMVMSYKKKPDLIDTQKVSGAALLQFGVEFF